MKVTLDAGNSALKARAWPEGNEVLEPGAEWLRVGKDSDSRVRDLLAWLDRLPGPFDAALIAVGDPSFEAAVSGLLRERARRFVEHPDPGLENRTRRPEQVGVDRLWAGRGALEEVGGSAIVLDAGTALTVDAVVRDGERGAFLGGAIAPGPDLAARALADGAARLPRVEPQPGGPALGQDTEGAIRSGVSLGFLGAAIELARAVAEEAGLLGAPVLLTGGASRFLLRERARFHRPPRLCEDLVHRGLRAAAFGAGEAAS